MAEHDDAGANAPSIRERNRALDQQLQRLVKAEQKLYLSQRALANQIKRVDALNRFAVAAAHTAGARELFEAAFSLMFELFPYEQALGLLANEDGALVPVAVGAVSGRHADSAKMLGVVADDPPLCVQLPTAPALDVWAGSPPCSVRDLFDRLFGEAERSDPPAMLIPLAERESPHRSAIILRRLDRLTSFHDELPDATDIPFLELVSQQIAASLANARLLGTLRRSYAELERTQTELVQRERMAAIGELAAVVAHEVRNPLGAIMNSSALLQRVAEPAAEVTQLLAIMGEETRRLERIVSDFLDFARPNKLSRTSISVATVAAEAVDSALGAADERGVTVELDCPDSAQAAVDPHLLRRALLNLITNAAQASHSGDVVHVRVVARDDMVCIDVTDRGCGISPEQVERLFEPFFTTKATGTGLGLTVVKRFADAHSGSVRVTSELGKGSVFTLRIPALSPSAT